MNSIEELGYIDLDVAYLLGLITARGKIEAAGGVRQILIEFPYKSLELQGFDQNTQIRLGLQPIQERLSQLTGADVSIINQEQSVVLALRFLRNTMAWRNILRHTQERISYEHFSVPTVLFSANVPMDWKREYIRGFADVAGNIRHSNRYVDGTNRVRLDVLNYPTNWNMPVQICTLLEEHLGVAVQSINWGHPNLGRGFREHQINIFVVPFGKIGFSLKHKQAILQEFIEADSGKQPGKTYKPCLGRKKIRRTKPGDSKENDEHLDERIRGRHFNAYWQICKKLGCPRTPKLLQQKLWISDQPEASEGTDEV